MSSLANSHYIFISSVRTDFNPNNEGYLFKVLLPKTLQIDNTWQVALVDIVYWNPFETTDIYRFFIEMDFLELSYVGPLIRPVLCTVPVLTDAFNRFHYAPKPPRYINITNINGLHEIKVYIKDNEGKILTDFDNDLNITLHFKRNI